MWQNVVLECVPAHKVSPARTYVVVVVVVAVTVAVAKKIVNRRWWVYSFDVRLCCCWQWW